MHFVVKSAICVTDRREARRLATNRRITVEAQHLVEEHGFDGFTMEDLAAAADVSRRTLFNHVGSKLDAVLGEFPVIPDALVQQFRDGGPHGDLFSDLGALAEEVVADHDATREEIALGRRMLADPRLLAASNERFAAYAEPFLDHIAAREGAAYDETRARVAVSVLVSLAEMALDDYVADTEGRPLVDHLTRLLAAARSLVSRT